MTEDGWKELVADTMNEKWKDRSSTIKTLKESDEQTESYKLAG
jgi:hypothetical protein